MTLLGVNHGAKAVVNWDFPTTDELSGLTGALAALFGDPTVTAFLIGAPRTQDLSVVEGGPHVDAAVWTGRQGSALVSVVNLDYDDIQGPVTISLPAGATPLSVDGSLWGDSTWQVTDNGTVSIAAGLSGLETAMFTVTLA